MCAGREERSDWTATSTGKIRTLSERLTDLTKQIFYQQEAKSLNKKEVEKQLKDYPAALTVKEAAPHSLYNIKSPLHDKLSYHLIRLHINLE